MARHGGSWETIRGCAAETWDIPGRTAIPPARRERNPVVTVVMLSRVVRCAISITVRGDERRRRGQWDRGARPELQSARTRVIERTGYEPSKEDCGAYYVR